ncbi:hypothetical protein [Prescottella agglutinans]|uniref:Uncharacterized protein n=1 Tax=Prescottella agglutinans TaxID=1644129 RepID=A0ABT6MIJ3_9NOCA|nr:hypothetical protein [Prescottella agglutinans]MDH6284146.1 hypothetical protein [Prescottella agglutinans]
MSVQKILTRAGYVFAALAAFLAVATLVGSILVVCGAIAPPSTGLLDTVSWISDASRIALLGWLTAATSAVLGVAATLAATG